MRYGQCETYGNAGLITRLLRHLTPKAGWITMGIPLPAETSEEEC